jgi:hypothetical protein
MSFVTTQPEELADAAGRLQTLGSAMAAESAAVASPTTVVIPAAADEVSALQATIFRAYGSLYQSINAQATAIHELMAKYSICVVTFAFYSPWLRLSRPDSDNVTRRVGFRAHAGRLLDAGRVWGPAVMRTRLLQARVVGVGGSSRCDRHRRVQSPWHR